MHLPLLLILAGSAAAVAVAAYLYRRARAGERHPACYFRCSHCGQKLRYGGGGRGRRLLCPHCLRPCALPQAGNDSPRDVPSPAGYRVRRA
jgi:hypothetical protein